MTPEDPTPDGRREDGLDARLARLERALGDLAARLSTVERHLGVEHQPGVEHLPGVERRPGITPPQQRPAEIDARPFGQGHPPARDAAAEARATHRAERDDLDAPRRSLDKPRGANDERRDPYDARSTMSDARRSASDEPRGASDAQRGTSDEQRSTSDAQRRASDEQRRASVEQRSASDERRSASAEQRSASDEQRGRLDGQRGASGGQRGASDEARTEGDGPRGASDDARGDHYGARGAGDGVRGESSAEDSYVSPHAGAAAAARVGVDADDYPFNIPPRVADSQGAGESRDGEESEGRFGGGVRSASSATGAASAKGAAGESSSSGELSAKRARRDLETLVGGSWFNWAGIVALTLGVGFFLKTAFENGWIGPAARVLLGGAAGCSLLALAERLRARGYRAYAHVMTGGGVLILYLSIYAAHVFYHLVGLTVAFALMSVVTATAVLLSVRYDALAIAVLALIGGFLTPVLLSTGVDKQIALFAYIAFLDAGVLAVAYFKRWRALNHLAFVATALTFAGWALRFYEPWKDWRTVFFLTLFFAMFAALAVVHNVLRRRPTAWPDVSLALSNATLYFTAVYAVLAPAHYRLLGAFALGVAVTYALLYLFARERHREDRLLASAYVVAAVTALTIAVSIQLGQHWITIGWAVEALMLTWLGLREDERTARYASLTVFVFAAERWMTVDLMRAHFDWQAAGFRDSELANQPPPFPILNARTFACAVLVGAMAGAVYLYRRRAEGVDKFERELIAALLTLAGNAFAVTALTADADNFVVRGAEGLAGGAIFRAETFAFTLLWAGYAACALGYGVLRRVVVLRYAALALLALSALALVFLVAPGYTDASHVAIFNQTFVAFAVVVFALAFGAWLYARAEWINEAERKPALYALAAAANVLAVAGLSLETLAYFDRAQTAARSAVVEFADSWGAVNKLENSKQLALTLLWAIYGCAAFTVGARRGRAYLRYGALALLALAACKVLALDARFYDAAWHAPLFNQTFAAFAAVVASGWYVARLYARAEGVSREEREKAVTAISVVGNLFAVAALSFEASGYFRKQWDERARADESARDLRLARQLSLSLVWAAYGGALLAYGHARAARPLRLLALALLAATTLKVFFYDLAGLEKFYRIISFIALGVVLLAVSFLYQQRQRRAREAEEV